MKTTSPNDARVQKHGTARPTFGFATAARRAARRAVVVLVVMGDPRGTFSVKQHNDCFEQTRGSSLFPGG